MEHLNNLEANDSGCFTNNTKIKKKQKNLFDLANSINSSNIATTTTNNSSEPLTLISHLSSSSGSNTTASFLSSIGRLEKRSIRRSSNILTPEHQNFIAGALLDNASKRTNSQRSSKSKKAEILNIFFLHFNLSFYFY